MSANSVLILEKLGFNLDFEKCEDFLLLENLLSCIDVDCVASVEEIDALDYADLFELEENDVVNKLIELGVDADILEINESSVEYLQDKLKSLKADKWDCTINGLKDQNDKLKRTLKELKEKSEALKINSLVKSGEEIWRKNLMELEQLFMELKSMNNKNESCPDFFNEFSQAFLKESNLFIEHVTEYVKRPWKRMIPITNEKILDTTENGDMLNDSTKGSHAEPDRAAQIAALNSRLTVIHYDLLNQKYEDYTDMRYRYKIATELSREKEERNSLQAFKSDVLILSEKQALLQIKENEVLYDLECTIEERESSLDTLKDIINILGNQQGLLDLVSVLKSLWKQPFCATQELVKYNIEYFHEEVADMKARIAHLEEHKVTFESYLNDKPNVFPQKLEQLVNKYFPSEEKSLQNMITAVENNLQQSMLHQKMCLIERANRLSDLEKNVESIEEDINSIKKEMSQLSIGLRTALQLLELKKEERTHINDTRK